MATSRSAWTSTREQVKDAKPVRQTLDAAHVYMFLYYFVNQNKSAEKLLLAIGEKLDFSRSQCLIGFIGDGNVKTRVNQIASNTMPPMTGFNFRSASHSILTFFVSIVRIYLCDESILT